MSVVLPLAGVPRTYRVSKSVENTQCHINTMMKAYFLSLSYKRETVMVRGYEFADTNVNEENTGMDITHVRAGG